MNEDLRKKLAAFMEDPEAAKYIATLESNDKFGEIASLLSEISSKEQKPSSSTFETVLNDRVDLAVDAYLIQKGDQFRFNASPKLGVDYFTAEDRIKIIEQSVPKKGVDYFTTEDVKEIVSLIVPLSKPKKGVDYFTDSEIKAFLKKITPVKGRDYFDGVPGTNSSFEIPNFKQVEVPTIEDFVRQVNNTPGSIELATIKGLDAHIKSFAVKTTKTTKLHGGGFSNIYSAGTIVSNGLTGLNFTGSGVASVTKNNSTGIITVDITGGGGASPLTTKGDLYTFTTVDARLGVGANGEVLSADSTKPTGLKWIALAGGGDMVLSANQVVTGLKTFEDATFALENVAGTFSATFTNTITANRVFTLPDAAGTIALTANKLSVFAATTSAELAGVISDETGTGALVFANSPTLVTPALGTPSALVGTNITGTAAGLSIGGNAATVTVADAGGDTTTFPMLATSATGSLAPATDAGLTYNATTNALTTTTFIGALTGNADTATSATSASTATTLQNTRTIWGQNFNGSANVTGTLALGTADLTLTGSVGATGARATKVWATDIESTNMPTVGGVSLSSTFQGLDTQLTSLAALAYAGNAGKFIRLNAGETDFEFATVSGSGTVTSVAMTVPTGLAIAGTPITTTGTLALTLDTGYVIPLQTTLDAKALGATTMTIAGTANQITSSAGAQDLSANRTWTLSFPSDVIIPTVLTVPNTGLHILDTNGTHDLIIAAGSNLTADRTLTVTTGDTNMILDLTAVTDEYVLAYDAGTNTWRGVVASGGGGGGPLRVDMLSSGTVPDATGDAFFEPYSILATNDAFKHLILRCGASNSAAPTVKAGVYGKFHVPADYNTGGTVTCKVYWTSTLTSGDVVFDLDYRAIGGDDTESLDQATYQESLTVTDTAPSAANERMVATMTLTASNLAADDTVEFFFGRDGADGADTLAGSAIVHEVIFLYTA